MNYDGPNRFSRVNSARTFPEVYYSERNVPLDYSRADHYAYQMGGPVSGLRNRPQLSREEYPLNQEVARRRIAVAVSGRFPSKEVGLRTTRCTLAACKANTDTSYSAHAVARGRYVAAGPLAMVKVVTIAMQRA